MSAQTGTRILRVYRALRVTGKVAKLMGKEGAQLAGAVNPAALAVDAALAVLDAGRAWFRYAAENEKTLRLEAELKILSARLYAQAEHEAQHIGRAHKKLHEDAKLSRDAMATFRLLDQAVQILGEQMAALARQGDNRRPGILIRRYEIFMQRYHRAVDRTERTTNPEDHE